MAASLSSSLQERVRQSGFGFISQSQGCQLLGQLLASPVGEVAVMPINWSRFREQISAVKPSFLEAFLEQADRATERSELIVKVQSVLPEERKQLLIAQVQKEIARVLGLSEHESIEPQQQLFDLGLDSLMALELRNRLQSGLGKSLSPTLLFDNPTLEMLVDYLASETLLQEMKSAETVLEGNLADAVEALSLQEESFSSCLVPLQSQGSRPPFFCVHPYAGVVFPYIELARLLGNNQPFYGLQAVGFNPGEKPLTRISDMAAAYVAALKTMQSQGPYRVGGWSMGAWILHSARQNVLRDDYKYLVILQT